MGKRLAAALALVVIALALCGGVEEKSGAPAGAEGTLLIVDADVQTLSLYEDGRHVKTYPCAVGARDTPTPLGVFRIAGKAADWGGGFGSRFLQLDCPWGTFGIHGTNKPASIGSAVSHGCIRMHNPDVEELYARVPVGSRVLIERAAYGGVAGGLRTLLPGDRGSDVREVQTRLIQKGYLFGAPDGVFGEYTKAALLRFKADKGLPASHEVDWATYRALGVLLFE